ncbi:MAG: glycosyltransferase [Promethearchaeota archaeon]
MSLLIISYIFPPFNLGAGTVMRNLCKNLPTEKFVVITTAEGLYVRWGIYDKGNAIDCNLVRLPVQTLSMLDQIIFCFLAVFQGIRLNRKKRVQNILAIYPYYFDLIAGYLLHKLLKKNLFVYMHDLFSESHKSALLYKIWFHFEKKVLASASKILVMNEKYVEHYSKRGFYNLALFPPSIDLDEYAAQSRLAQRPKRTSGKLRISYTGTIQDAQEDAVLTLLKAAGTMDDVEVLIASPNKDGYMKKEVSKSLSEVNLGFLPKKESIALQRSADVLFIALSGESYLTEEINVAFPCKLLEYLAAGKPILALVPKGSFVEAFVNKHQVGIVVNELSVKKTVDAINSFKNGEMREKFSQNALKTAKLFDSKNLSERLFKIMNDVEVKTVLTASEEMEIA